MYYHILKGPILRLCNYLGLPNSTTTPSFITSILSKSTTVLNLCEITNNFVLANSSRILRCINKPIHIHRWCSLVLHLELRPRKHSARETKKLSLPLWNIRSWFRDRWIQVQKNIRVLFQTGLCSSLATGDYTGSFRELLDGLGNECIICTRRCD